MDHGCRMCGGDHTINLNYGAQEAAWASRRNGVLTASMNGQRDANP